MSRFNPITPYFRDVPETRASIENPSVPITDVHGMLELLGASGSGAGVYVTPESAMRFAAVFACVRVLAETVASLPFQLFDRTEQGKELATSPLYRLIHDQPNPWLSSFDWREVMVTHTALWGNHYSFIDQTEGGNILGLYPLMPSEVRPRRLETREIVYDVQTDRGGETLKSWQVLHIRGPGWDGLQGQSPIGLMRQAVGIGMAADRFVADFFANDARPGVIIETPAGVSPNQGDKIKEQMDRKFGPGNKWKTMTTGPGIKLHPVQMPLTDAQFIEQRKFQRNEICAIYRVPPHMIGDLDKATFSNIEQQDIGFAKHTILPWLRRIEQECNAKLISRRNPQFVEFNLDGLLRGDFKSRMEGYALGVNSGIYNRDEVRELENFKSEPALKKFLVQGAMVTVNEDGSLEHPEPKPAAAPADKPAEKPAA
jgi:HK97 family phage portal protein